MPSRSQLPGELKRKKFINALERLGFEISTKGGSGDYMKVTWLPTQKMVTVQRHVRKDVLYYLLKEIEVITNREITWEDIKKKL